MDVASASVFTTLFGLAARKEARLPFTDDVLEEIGPRGVHTYGEFRIPPYIGVRFSVVEWPLDGASVPLDARHDPSVRVFDDTWNR